MLVSIIIPVHKTHSFFIACIKSALSQTHQNIEIIVACNGNLEIKECRLFLEIEDSRLIFIKTSSGRDNARNEALALAKGDWIQFLDYDDYLFPEKIELQLEALKKSPNCKLSICQWKKFFTKIEVDYNFPFNTLYDEPLVTAESLVQKMGVNGGFIATGAWLVSKEFIHGLKWIDSPNDDAVFLSEILKKSPQIVMISSVLVGYRIHGDNTSSIRTKSEFDKLLNSWTKIYHNLRVLKVFEINRYLYLTYLNLIYYSKELKGYRIGIIIFNVFYFGFKSKIGFSIFRDIKKEILR
ncbi:glycosyltransferase family 2 protein [Flavobacterium pectinovorum]|jgi:glycosyltransferase involved in cell wall biosynthesis|uniref:Glycosyltransferase family 2 protein n=1 Tax=Flavobacterium pectinovorum TaxID=29533 RepID=A0A502EQM6_9FLAO|nr:glycosyltransferase family A protein [Flavobacterium pectinovorum]TPG40115.1 glycosyltransferase family 2 protein [Flavobacterium pectinovorum]